MAGAELPGRRACRGAFREPPGRPSSTQHGSQLGFGRCRSRPVAIVILSGLRYLLVELCLSKGWLCCCPFSAGCLQALFILPRGELLFDFPSQIYFPEQGIPHLFKMTCPLPFPACRSGWREKSSNSPAVFPLLLSHRVQIAGTHCAGSTDQSGAAHLHFRNNWAAAIRMY